MKLHPSGNGQATVTGLPVGDDVECVCVCVCVCYRSTKGASELLIVRLDYVGGLLTTISLSDALSDDGIMASSLRYQSRPIQKV